MGTYRAVIRISHASLGGFGSNTWHIRTTGVGGTDNSQLDEAMTAVEDFYQACVGSFPDTANMIFDGTCDGILDNAGETEEIDGWTVPGGTPGPALPPANAIVVGWRASTGGRSGRGRTFLGPICTAANESNGTIAPTQLNAVRAAATALVDASTGPGEWAVGVFSPQDSLVRDITASAVRDLFAVLRSRRD